MQYRHIAEGINSNTFMDDIFGIGSHYSKHEDDNSSSVLNRFLSENISASSVFTNINDSEFLIGEVIFMSRDGIEEWLYNSKTPTLEISERLPSEEYDGYVGEGYKKDVKGHISEYATETITC